MSGILSLDSSSAGWGLTSLAAHISDLAFRPHGGRAGLASRRVAALEPHGFPSDPRHRTLPDRRFSRRHPGEVPMELVGLWRYPVKSMQGERLDRARMEDNGIV